MSSPAWKDWERKIAEHASLYGFDWKRRLRQGDSDDMLDIDGPLDDGFLVGGKTGQRMGDRMCEAMDQCRRAKANLAKLRGSADGVIPVQIMKRRSTGAGRAYAVMEYDDFLRLAVERREWRQR